MANESREERRQLKEQERLAKAELKAAAKAEKQAAREAAKAERKARKDGGAGTTETTEEPLEPIPVRPRLELVTEPGPVKHVHWDANPTEPVVRLRTPAPTPPRPEPVPQPPSSTLQSPGGQTYVQEHVYRPVDTTPAPATTPTQPIVQEQHEVAAWEPSATLQQVTRPERTPTTRPTPRPRTTPRTPTTRRTVRATRRTRKPTRVYPGDNHPVIDIEGIGPVYAKKLEAMGITTTGLLGVAKPGRVAARLQVPRKTVRKWQAEAELIKVRGIGPQFAEALARSGITGIDELKRRKPDDVARQVAKYLASVDQTVVGQPVTAKRVARWKRKALPMRRVKANLETLAIPTHGIPPPWLRESTGTAKGKTTKHAGRTTRGTRTARTTRTTRATRTTRPGRTTRTGRRTR